MSARAGRHPAWCAKDGDEDTADPPARLHVGGGWVLDLPAVPEQLRPEGSVTVGLVAYTPAGQDPPAPMVQIDGDPDDMSKPFVRLTPAEARALARNLLEVAADADEVPGWVLTFGESGLQFLQWPARAAAGCGACGEAVAQ